MARIFHICTAACLAACYFSSAAAAPNTNDSEVFEEDAHALLQVDVRAHLHEEGARHSGPEQDASNFLKDVTEIISRPEMPEHLRLAAGGDTVEGQLVAMQFMPLGSKYGADISRIVTFDGRGPSWDNFCKLSESNAGLRAEIKELANRWWDIVGTFEDAPTLTRNQASAFIRDAEKLLKKPETKDCIQLFQAGDAKTAAECWPTLSKPVLSKYGLKPYNVPKVLPQILLLGREDAAMREQAMAFSENWMTFASAMGIVSVDKSTERKTTGLSKAYAMAFIDEIGVTLEKQEVQTEMAKIRDGDPCAEAAVSAHFKAVCAKHHFQSGSGSMPPVLDFAKLGPDVKERVWNVMEKWAQLVRK